MHSLPPSPGTAFRKNVGVAKQTEWILESKNGKEPLPLPFRVWTVNRIRISIQCGRSHGFACLFELVISYSGEWWSMVRRMVSNYVCLYIGNSNKNNDKPFQKNLCDKYLLFSVTDDNNKERDDGSSRPHLVILPRKYILATHRQCHNRNDSVVNKPLGYIRWLVG